MAPYTSFKGVLMYGPLVCIGYIRGSLFRAHTKGPCNYVKKVGKRDKGLRPFVGVPIIVREVFWGVLGVLLLGKDVFCLGIWDAQGLGLGGRMLSGTVRQCGSSGEYAYNHERGQRDPALSSMLGYWGRGFGILRAEPATKGFKVRGSDPTCRLQERGKPNETLNLKP